MATKTAAILGLDTAAGAYLARLLGARGYVVRGTGGTDLLARLGVADDVSQVDDVAEAIAGANEIYDLRGDIAATADLLALGGTARVFVAGGPGTVIATPEGRFVAIGIVYPHESRLGPGTSPVARIVAAAAAGTDPDPADLATTTDCGWTAEYVDAMWRMLQRPAAEVLAIATGRVLSGAEVARIAAAYFKRAEPPATVEASAIRVAGDPGPAAAALGWRAVTWGDDLVTVLCEGAAAQ
ncbi:MAG: GDP-mannose 4,6-dehydratase [Janthinobacterium lividum]